MVNVYKHDNISDRNKYFALSVLCSRESKQNVRFVPTDDTSNNIIEKIDNSKTLDKTKTVLARLTNAPNLITVKAIYDANCMSHFIQTIP